METGKKLKYKSFFSFILFCFTFVPINACQILDCKGDTKYVQDGCVENVVIQSRVDFKSDEKIYRKGILIRKKDAPATIVLCHGYICTKNDAAFLRYMFDKYNTLIFDFRAHGEDVDGQLCTFGYHEALDVNAAVELLKSYPDLKDKPIIGYGFSMGAVSLIMAESKYKNSFKALILDCPFDSSDNILKRAVDNLRFYFLGYEVKLPGRKLLKRYAYNYYVQFILKWFLKSVSSMDYQDIETFVPPMDIVGSLEKITIPCFFINCKNDEKVPIGAAKNVYSAPKGFKRLWITNGRNHYDSFFYNPEKYSYKINRFVNKVLTDEYKTKKIQKIFIDK